MAIQFAYQVGQHVDCRDAATDVWRKAEVTKLSPYHGAPGYHVMFLPQPQPRELATSGLIGGWTHEGRMRLSAV